VKYIALLLAFQLAVYCCLVWAQDYIVTDEDGVELLSGTLDEFVLDIDHPDTSIAEPSMTISNSNPPIVLGPYKSIRIGTHPIDKRGSFYTTAVALVEVEHESGDYYITIHGEE
jgi:hypothetical protein